MLSQIPPSFWPSAFFPCNYSRWYLMKTRQLFAYFTLFRALTISFLSERNLLLSFSILPLLLCDTQCFLFIYLTLFSGFFKFIPHALFSRKIELTRLKRILLFIFPIFHFLFRYVRAFTWDISRKTLFFVRNIFRLKQYKNSHLS